LKPRLLIAADSSPFPPYDGKRQRSLALMEAASSKYLIDYLILGNYNDFLSTKDIEIPGVDFYFLPQMSPDSFIRKMGFGFWRVKSNKNHISKFLERKNYSKILCRYASSAVNFPCLDKVIIDVDDDYVESMKTKIAVEKQWLKKIRLKQILELNKRAYKKILIKASGLIFSKQQNFPFKYSFLPNLPFQSILLEKKRQFILPETKDLLFVGKLNFPPNLHGIYWFLEEVWPNLKIKHADIRLTIVSVIEPDDSLRTLIQNRKDVQFLVNVDDMDKVYQQHFLALAPIFFGSGSSIKLIEALYHYRKVICTPFGARGFTQFENLGIVTEAESPQEWLNAIELLLNQDYNEKNFESVKSHFSFENWTKQLLGILNEE